MLAPLALGEDPFDLDWIGQKVATTLDRAGWTGDFGKQAWSGLEVALWDLMGKAVGRPVSQLLGGRVRDRVMAYATGLYDVPTAPDPTAARQEEARGYVERGYRATTMKVGGLAPSDDLREVAGMTARASAWRSIWTWCDTSPFAEAFRCSERASCTMARPFAQSGDA